MAKITLFADDLDNTQDETVKTRYFALENEETGELEYREIDLSDANNAKLHNALKRFLTASRPQESVKGSKTRTIAATTDYAPVREWARKQQNEDGTPKFDIKDSGRVPKHVLDAFNARDTKNTDESKPNDGDVKDNTDANTEQKETVNA